MAVAVVQGIPRPSANGRDALPRVRDSGGSRPVVAEPQAHPRIPPGGVTRPA